LKRRVTLNDTVSSEGGAPVAPFQWLETSTANPDYDTVVDARGAAPGAPSAQAIQRDGFNHAFPDPFDPRWERSLRERVRATVAALKGKPYFAA
jgi:hypothetical protein